MDKAHYLNDIKRQYTASSRLFYQVEQLPGFEVKADYQRIYPEQIFAIAEDNEEGSK